MGVGRGGVALLSVGGGVSAGLGSLTEPLTLGGVLLWVLGSMGVVKTRKEEGVVNGTGKEHWRGCWLRERGTEGCETSPLQAGTDDATFVPRAPLSLSLVLLVPLGGGTKAGLAFREESQITFDKETKGHGNNSSLSRWAIWQERAGADEGGTPPKQPKTNRAAGSSHAPR